MMEGLLVIFKMHLLWCISTKFFSEYAFILSCLYYTQMASYMDSFTDVKITVSSLKIQHAITSSTVQKHMYTSLNHENMCNQC